MTPAPPLRATKPTPPAPPAPSSGSSWAVAGMSVVACCWGAVGGTRACAVGARRCTQSRESGRGWRPGREAAVVGKPHEIKGEAIVAFVVLKGSRPDGAAAQEIATKLRDWVAQEIGPIAKPDDIRFGDNLPKTRSGKIMRRLLRSLAKGEDIKQDVATPGNPAILEQLKTAVR